MIPKVVYPLRPLAYSHNLSSKNNGSFFSQSLSIKTRNLRPSKPGDLLTPKSLAVENKFTISQALNIQGNFESVIPENIDSEIEDYSLRIGSSVKTKDFRAGAAYRRRVPTLLEESQGLFFNLDYQPWRFVSLSTNVDRQWADTDNKISHGLFRLSISPLSFASVVTGMEFNDGDFYTKTLTTEIRKIWDDIETWMKGGLIYKEAKADENRHFAEFGLNYGPSRNFHLQFNNGYEKCNSFNNSAELIKFGGGINFKLPLPTGMEFQNSLNVDKAIEEEDINYQFLSSITIPRS
ncbi:MAG TPA: hypothetical protein VNN20_04625 [Thermodesulfobacteriota bacterium]|nr:hypothetical protein [Thermodesulfobacteriota bacterium]